jgi:NAD(P)H-hydrate epimerase
MIALDVAQMRALDAREGAARGASVLMREAGSALATLVRRYARASSLVVGVAGPGNNGGDVFAALAALGSDYECLIFALDAPDASEARRDAALRAEAAGVSVRRIDGPLPEETLAQASVVLDGILGVGSRLPLSPPFDALAAAVRRCPRPVIAIDLPTGVDATTGAADPNAVRARATLAIGALKLGLLLEPARGLLGDLWLAPIGFPSDVEAAAEPPAAQVLDDAEFRRLLPPRGESSDKRRAGAPLLVAGSEQFPGAGVLAARGAARAGAGYVTVAAPHGAAAALRAHLIEQVVVTYDDARPDEAIERILDLTGHQGALGIGPGLGLADDVGTIVRGVIERTHLPMVLDASALFHLAKHLEIARGKQIVVTPHAGEFARLSGRGTIAEGERVPRIREFVERTGITTLLKGGDTLIFDGHTLHVNPTGSAVLATAGTGDVLTGMIATLLAQGLAPVDAARAAAYWHGVAGRVAHLARPVGVVAGDLPEHLAAAVRHRPQRVEGLIPILERS